MSDYEQKPNRGSVWGERGYSGRCVVNGMEYTVGIVSLRTSKGNTPTHVLSLTNKERGYACVLWRPKSEGSKAVATGTLADLGVRVSVFKNDKKSDQSPDFGLMFHDVEADAPSTQGIGDAEKPPTEPDAPF